MRWLARAHGHARPTRTLALALTLALTPALALALTLTLTLGDARPTRVALRVHALLVRGLHAPSPRAAAQGPNPNSNPNPNPTLTPALTPTPTLLQAGLPDDEQILWWSKGGAMLGESPARILWFRQYVAATPALRLGKGRMRPWRERGASAFGCECSCLVSTGIPLVANLHYTSMLVRVLA